MTYNYPYFYPSRRYSNYNYNYYKYYQPTYSQSRKKKIEEDLCKKEEKPKLDPCNSNCDNESREFFEIFGIKLFFDDILLMCLIFFLYNEGVKDQYLFISLILLLLS